MTQTDTSAVFTETDRFTEIEKLTKGWFDGQSEGEVVAPIALQEGRRLRDVLNAAGVKNCVFATIEGGVAIEDTADVFEDSFTITICPDGSALVLGMSNEEDEEYEDARTLPAASPWLSAFLARQKG